MARTITALFDTRTDAEAGGERLRQAGVDASNVRVHDQTGHRTTGTHSTREDKGLWASIKNVFLPDADRHAYEEGVRRGGFLLTADVDDDATPAAVKALEEANSIDLDERSQQWRDEGWNSPVSPVDAGETEGLLSGYREADYSGNRYRTYSSNRPIDHRL